MIYNSFHIDDMTTALHEEAQYYKKISDSHSITNITDFYGEQTEALESDIDFFMALINLLD